MVGGGESEPGDNASYSPSEVLLPVMNGSCSGDSSLIAASVLYTYILPVICVIGVVLNLLNILVFSAPHLRHHVLYSLLLSLSLLDLTALLLTLPAAAFARCYCPEVCPVSTRRVSSHLLWYDARIIYPLTNTVSTAAIWMTMIVALERLIYINYHNVHLTRLTRSRHGKPVPAWAASAITCLVSILFHIPLYKAKAVSPHGLSVVNTDYSTQPGYLAYSWCRLLFARVLPALILIIACVLLVRGLRKPLRIVGHGAHISIHHQRVNSVITRMVALVVLLFLVFDVQVGLTTSSTLLRQVAPAAGLTDSVLTLIVSVGSTLELSSNLINFFIYYSCNQVFRHQLLSLYQERCSGIGSGSRCSWSRLQGRGSRDQATPRQHPTSTSASTSATHWRA